MKFDISCKLGRSDRIVTKFQGVSKGRFTTAHVYLSFYVYRARTEYIDIDEVMAEAMETAGGGSSGGICVCGGSGGSSGSGSGGCCVYGYTGNSPPDNYASTRDLTVSQDLSASEIPHTHTAMSQKPRLMKKLTALAFVVLIALLNPACKDSGKTDEDDSDEQVEYTDVQLITINSFADIAKELPNINEAAKNKNTKVVVSFKRIGVNATQLREVREFNDGQYLKTNVEVVFLGFYPTEPNVMISFAEWEKLGEPRLTKDVGFAFVTTEADLAKFTAAGVTSIESASNGNGNGNGGEDPGNGGEEPVVGGEKVVILNAGEIATKAATAEGFANAGKSVNVYIGNDGTGAPIAVNAANMEDLKKLLNDKIVIVTKNMLLPAGPATAAHGKVLAKLGVGKTTGGVKSTGEDNYFFVTGANDVHLLKDMGVYFGTDTAKASKGNTAKFDYTVPQQLTGGTRDVC